MNKQFNKLCKVCGNEFMACRVSNVMCSQKCRNKLFNGTYVGKCIDCGVETSYVGNKRCRPCEVIRRHVYSSQILRKRFFKKVKKTPTCWVWQASRTTYGYGYFGYKDVCYLAHRVSYELHFGKLPNGKQALHKCDNPPCVRPSHLYAGTPLDNVLDQHNKNRWPEQQISKKSYGTIKRRTKC